MTLRGVKPPIWRRIEVRSEATLAEVFVLLEAAMGWLGGHLHAFDVSGVIYEPPDPDDDLFGHAEDEAAHRLGEVLLAAKAKMRWDYDFGDGWQHDVLVESIEPAADERTTHDASVAAELAHRRTAVAPGVTATSSTRSPIRGAVATTN